MLQNSLSTVKLLKDSSKYECDKVKDNMKKSDIVFYSILYIATVVVFIGVIYFTAEYPGADLALKLIKDDT